MVSVVSVSVSVRARVRVLLTQGYRKGYRPRMLATKNAWRFNSS